MITSIIDFQLGFSEINHLALNIWFSGCHLRCKGCHNPELFDHKLGFDDYEVYLHLREARKMTDWLVFLGGNPMDSIIDLRLISHFGKSLGFRQVLFTGYTIQETKDLFSNFMGSLTKNFEVIKFGRYLENQKCENSSKLASRNQGFYKWENDDWVQIGIDAI